MLAGRDSAMFGRRNRRRSASGGSRPVRAVLREAVRPVCEALEGRRLLASVNVLGSTATLTGANTGEVIHLTGSGSNSWFTVGGSQVGDQFGIGTVTNIVVNAGAGND